MKEALADLADSAAKTGANAIINIQVDIESVSGAKTKGMFMASVTGMAVRIRRLR